MKPRSIDTLKNILLKNGFVKGPQQSIHAFYYLEVDGKKSGIFTYLNQEVDEYNSNQMGQLKKQLRFEKTREAVRFFEGSMTQREYLIMLENQGDI